MVSVSWTSSKTSWYQKECWIIGVAGGRCGVQRLSTRPTRDWDVAVSIPRCWRYCVTTWTMLFAKSTWRYRCVLIKKNNHRLHGSTLRLSAMYIFRHQTVNISSISLTEFYYNNIAMRTEAVPRPVWRWRHQHNGRWLWTTGSERRTSITTVGSSGDEMTDDLLAWQQLSSYARSNNRHN